ncbi:hypothetical protein [Pseudomonas aeruginosa]|uniref:hypothetical protein n=1 Tax=Pseudomonas aeruginosa TaxID=287 RepID=UPI003747F015
MDDTILIYRATYGTPEQVAQLYAAFAKAQGAFEPIAKNREVEIPIKDKNTGAQRGSYKFRYADLEEINSKNPKTAQRKRPGHYAVDRAQHHDHRDLDLHAPDPRRRRLYRG